MRHCFAQFAREKNRAESPLGPELERGIAPTRNSTRVKGSRVGSTGRVDIAPLREGVKKFAEAQARLELDEQLWPEKRSVRACRPIALRRRSGGTRRWLRAQAARTGQLLKRCNPCISPVHLRSRALMVKVVLEELVSKHYSI